MMIREKRLANLESVPSPPPSLCLSPFSRPLSPASEAEASPGRILLICVAKKVPPRVRLGVWHGEPGSSHQGQGTPIY